MSADLLRRAATVLRERAGRATAGPWAITFGTVRGDEQYPIAPMSRRSDSEFIATMDPIVGLALADWLDRAAWAEDMSGYKPQVPHKDHALTVARAVLGEAS